MVRKRGPWFKAFEVDKIQNYVHTFFVEPVLPQEPITTSVVNTDITENARKTRRSFILGAQAMTKKDGGHFSKV